MKRVLYRILIYLLLWSAGLAGLIILGTAQPPPSAPTITGPFSRIDEHALPELQRYQARDGAQLSFREYPAAGDQVAVLIHGSAGSSLDMHPLALALQQVGVTVLVPDLRGHGANQPHGDIDYVGQLDDDLADFVAKEKPNLRRSVWTVLGFSSGAAFALRIAAESPLDHAFDHYMLVAPYLRYNAPSVRPTGPGATHSQSWAAVSTGRIIGLRLLNFLGVHFWDGLPVLAFPVPANTDSVTRAYSWRLQKNFGADDDYLGDIRRANRPVQVFVGGADELLDAQKLKVEFQAQRADISVSILPGMSHSEMVTNPDAIRALVAAFP